MSQDYGTVDGYGFEITGYDENKMLKFLLQAKCCKDYLRDMDININQVTLDDFDDYGDNYCILYGIEGAFSDAVQELTSSSDLSFEVNEDMEYNDFYLMYISSDFPKRAITKEEVDGILKDIQEKVGINTAIEYQHVHWFG